MEKPATAPVEALIVALPETAGSALYGMVDVLASTGRIWQELTGEPPGIQQIRPRIAGLSREAFRCGNGIPVTPEVSVAEDPSAEIVILPEMWLAPDDPVSDRYADMLAWVRRRYRAGSTIYSACSGTVLLAASGLLAGRDATSHWGYQDLFRTHYPDVRFRPEPNLVFADASGRIVTAGGTTSWHDLAIHIISRHASPGEALRIAKVYLLKWHGEGQLPYASLARRQPHADSAVRAAEDWLRGHFQDDNPVAGAVAAAGVPARSLERRFKAATGTTLIGYVQNLRVEEAKRHLETCDKSFEDIAFEVGYENPAFFRRVFKRATGLTPAAYRRMFQPIAHAALPVARADGDGAAQRIGVPE